MTPALRVAVPPELLGVDAAGGHGKVWRRVLDRLGESADLVPLGRRRARSPHVVLASGHVAVPRTGTPLVVQVHEAGWFEPQLRQLLHPDFLDQIEPATEAAVRAAAHVITPSQSARRDVARAYGLDIDTVHGIHHGADPVFRPEAPGGRALVARAQGGHTAPYVLYAGMLHPRKNLAALREAMAGLAADGLPHVLVVVGGPATDRPDSDGLERAAAAELPGAPGRLVRFRRPDDDQLAALMAGADAFCLPSLYEGFGLTVIEAMACGTPVVVSDRGSLPEVVDDAGVVVPPEPQAVREALRRVLTSPALAQDLGRAGAKRAESFTWERTAAGWLEVLRAAAAGESHPSRAQYTRRR